MNLTSTAAATDIGFSSFAPAAPARKRASPPEKCVAVRNGENDIESDFRAIYNRCRHRIYSVAMRYLKSDANAQEVVQDVFLKLWTERASIKRETPVEAWLYTVAKNHILNKLKRKAIEGKAAAEIKAVRATDCDDSTERRLYEKENLRLLRTAVDSLSANQRTVFQMAREESLSYVQIAERLNISPLTVKTHMARALAYLKGSLPV